MIVVFDLDGTLIDSAADIHSAVNHVLAENSVPPLPLTAVRSFIGEGTRVLMQRVIAAVGADPALLEPWHTSFLAEYERNPAVRTTVFPGVREALAQLRERGARLGLCTNKPARATGLLLEALDLAVFDQVTAGDTLAERKPSPLPVLHTIDVLGGGEAVFIGDSEIDARAAEAGRIPFGIFTGGYAREDLDMFPSRFHFSDWADLPALINPAFVDPATSPA
ncbi:MULTISPECIES: phosphoglycolate phosphatase [unclassified Haematobacter]|uniref:phosphoglycolate phosphatase n=1 Tax=unclassified Haematobacter TaxID=2640585 RepID=UPI0025C5EA27|nr:MULTISPECIES: phosphoglycolate phosphatase [unclassified Haematobacter]